MSVPISLKVYQLLASCSCHTISCIVLVKFYCEPERTDKDEKNFVFFSPLNNISLELAVCSVSVQG